MNARMETIRRLAESDQYWRGYLDGMTAAHHDNSAAHEYARLSQARIDRNTDTTDYDADWRRASDARDAATPASPGVFAWSADASPLEEVRERLRARRLGLPYPARLDVDPHSEEYRRLSRVLADVTAVDALTDYDLNA